MYKKIKTRNYVQKMILGTDVNIPIPDSSRGRETCYSKSDPQEQNLQLHNPTQPLEMQSP